MNHHESGKTRVMIVNDSHYARTYLTDMVNSSQKLELLCSARDGVEAVEKLRHTKPDVILLDLEMPNMDGLTFIENVMHDNPVPIVVCSSYVDGRGADILFEALQAGA